jgi:hypothetical protein
MALAELRAATPPDRTKTGADTPSAQAASQAFGDDVFVKAATRRGLLAFGVEGSDLVDRNPL